MKAAHPIDSLRMSAEAAKPSDRLFYGDIRSKKYRAHLETCHTLPRSEAMEAGVYTPRECDIILCTF